MAKNNKKINLKNIRTVKKTVTNKIQKDSPISNNKIIEAPISNNKVNIIKNKNKKSIVKSLGVKSIHYIKDDDTGYNLYLENGFKLTKVKSQELKSSDNILAKGKYDNIDTLNTLDDLPKLIINDFSFELNDKETRGFKMSRINGSCAFVNNVVQHSFISNLIHQSDNRLKTNNIDIQLFHNCLDLKKIIGLYINDIILGIQSRKIDVSEKLIDLISQSRNTRTRKLNINDKDYKSDLNDFYYIFRSYPIKNLLDKHKDDEKNVITHDIINLLSDFRNFTVHAENKLNDFEFFDSEFFKYEYIKELFDNFIQEFKKSNSKTLNILSSYYDINPTSSLDSYQKLCMEYFEFVLKDGAKNFDISINKIQKIIFEKYRFKEIFEENKTKNADEILNKLKSSIKFIIYRHYSSQDASTLQEFNRQLVSSLDNLETYVTYIVPKILNSNVININKLLEIIKYNVGKKELEELPTIDYEIILSKDHIFIDYLFILSLFLTTKNANSFFSDILTKYQSIIDLLELRTSISKDGYTFKISKTELNSVLNTLPVVFDFAKYFNDKTYGESLMNKILLMKGLRSKYKKTKSTITSADFNYIYNSISSKNYTYKKFKDDLENTTHSDVLSANKVKSPKYPLKNFIANQIYNSKYYEYISSFTGANFIKELMKSKNVIKLVFDTMYSNYKDVANLFLTKVYASFKKPQHVRN